MKKGKPVVCTTLLIEVLGPMDARVKRIRFIEDILRNCIRTPDRDFRASKFQQMKGFSLKPEPERGGKENADAPSHPRVPGSDW
jgi:hypothetical protein